MRRHSTTSSKRGDARLEGLDRGAVLERELDVHGDLEAAADGGGVDVGVVAADHAGPLERADAAQARRTARAARARRARRS